MDSESIIKKLRDILLNDITLSGYVKNVFIGDRRMYADVYPVIVLEPESDVAVEEFNGGIKGFLFKVNIAGAILIRDVEYQIVGDANRKGILDLEKDVKNALKQYYPDLDNTCLDFNLGNTEYRIFEDGNGRSFVISGEFYYRRMVV